MTTRLSPQIPGGKLLWRLRSGSNQQLWCSVGKSDRYPCLSIYDPATERSVVVIRTFEGDITPLINRAEGMRRQCLAAGWQDVDEDLDEPNWPLLA